MINKILKKIINKALKKTENRKTRSRGRGLTLSKRTVLSEKCSKGN